MRRFAGLSVSVFVSSVFVSFVSMMGAAGGAWAQTKAVVAPAGGNGMEEALLPVVTGALRESVAGRGWTVLGAEETEPVVLVAGTPPVPSTDEMRRLAGTASARLAAHVHLTKAKGGRVVVRVRSATREGPGAWEAVEEVPAGDVIPALRRLTERAVPPAAVVAGPPAPPPIVSPGPPVVSPGPPVVSPTPGPPVVSPAPDGLPPIMENSAAQPQPPGGAAPAGAPVGAGLEAEVPLPPVARPLRYHLWVGPMTEGAIGTNRDYYNHLAGARATYLLARQFGFNLAATYAYYSDDPGFATAFWGGVEARIGLSSTKRTSIPVRFGLGFAPLNGAIVKVEGGLLFPLSPKTDLVLTLLSPTIWFLEGGNAVSMNVGLDLSFAAL